MAAVPGHLLWDQRWEHQNAYTQWGRYSSYINKWAGLSVARRKRQSERAGRPKTEANRLYGFSCLRWMRCFLKRFYEVVKFHFPFFLLFKRFFLFLLLRLNQLWCVFFDLNVLSSRFFYSLNGFVWVFLETRSLWRVLLNLSGDDWSWYLCAIKKYQSSPFSFKLNCKNILKNTSRLKCQRLVLFILKQPAIPISDTFFTLLNYNSNIALAKRTFPAKK